MNIDRVNWTGRALPARGRNYYSYRPGLERKMIQYETVRRLVGSGGFSFIEIFDVMIENGYDAKSTLQFIKESIGGLVREHATTGQSKPEILETLKRRGLVNARRRSHLAEEGTVKAIIDKYFPKIRMPPRHQRRR